MIHNNYCVIGYETIHQPLQFLYIPVGWITGIMPGDEGENDRITVEIADNYFENSSASW